jgi:hypothetical protein
MCWYNDRRGSIFSAATVVITAPDRCPRKHCDPGVYHFRLRDQDP